MTHRCLGGLSAGPTRGGIVSQLLPCRLEKEVKGHEAAESSSEQESVGIWMSGFVYLFDLFYSLKAKSGVGRW